MPAFEPSVDPRAPQKRLAVTPSGRQVWVDISGDDRLRVVNGLPGRWSEVIRRRESGESIDEIRDKMRIKLPIFEHCQGECDPPCLKDYIADCYSHIETALHDLAAKRARLLV